MPTMSETTPEAKAASRQPMPSISSAIGVAVRPPTAKPIVSTPVASTRRLRNQLTIATRTERKLPSEEPIAISVNEM